MPSKPEIHTIAPAATFPILRNLEAADRCCLMDTLFPCWERHRPAWPAGRSSPVETGAFRKAKAGRHIFVEHEDA